MSRRPAPAAELEITPELVRALLGEQAPALAERPLTPVASGWDSTIMRLGDDLAVRLPRRGVAAELVRHEQVWLPVLAPRLPVPVPDPVVAGRPALGYPWPWSVVPWFDGRSAAQAAPIDLDRTADQLAGFLAALHRPAPPHAPANAHRGGPLADRDETTRRWLTALDRQLPGGLAPLWRRLAAAPAYSGEPVWLHGDLHPDNLVVDDAGLRAVIDFGDITAGDPATDLAIGWLLLPTGPRRRLRDRLGVDEATWHRAAGWALSLAVMLIAHSRDDPAHERVGRTAVAALLDEFDPVNRAGSDRSG